MLLQAGKAGHLPAMQEVPARTSPQAQGSHRRLSQDSAAQGSAPQSSADAAPAAGSVLAHVV